MNLIPVIDVMNGQVVRGMQGNRQAYRPIVSRLCGSSEPLAVAAQLVDHCAARMLYLADLDALQGGAVQIAVLQELLARMPAVSIWLDGGFADVAAAQAVREALMAGAERVVPVFGSESLRSREALQACRTRFGAEGMVLSLDRRAGERLDEAGCWDAPELWPTRVIAMTLERVGAGTGPDLDTLAALQQRSPATRLIGAGGVRSPADLQQAEACGAAGWLVASALHDLQLPRTPR